MDTPGRRGRGGHLRLAIVNLTSGGLSGGYRSYLRHLLPRLTDRPEVSALSVFIPPSGGAEGGIAGAAVRAWPEEVRRRPGAWITTELKRFHPDVVFVPTARAFRFSEVPTVTMVRNMEPMVCPVRGNSPSEAIRNLARREVARFACRRADRVIAVSNFVRTFLREAWKIPADRIGVVHHGVGIDESGAVAPSPLAGNAAPFMFTAGSIRPARGLEDLLHAFSGLGSRFPDLRLAIAGTADTGSERYARRVRQWVDSSGLANRVLWLGNLSAPGMAWCYRNAALFVMTSRVEACPNVVLEAMANGALCLSTTSPPMPEFFGPGVAYYTSGDAGSLTERASHLLAMARDDVLASRHQVVARAAQFDWQLTVDRTIAELTLAIGGRAPATDNAQREKHDR